MKQLVKVIPIFKWLLVLPQLTSRICHHQADIQQLIQQLLGRICDAFPHQALWALAAVVKSSAKSRSVSGGDESRLIGRH